MARISRGEVFAPDEVAIVRVMNRVVRRCFLLADDPVTGKNYDHRKGWIEEHLKRQAAFFGIDLLGFAIMSNHFHLILRSRPDVVATWDDSEVARRWLMQCPIRKTAEGQPEVPPEPELNSIHNNPQRVATIRRATLAGGCGCCVSMWPRGPTARIRRRAEPLQGGAITR